MNQNGLYIKNMVCPRCVDTVKNIISDLDLPISSIRLGEVILQKKINSIQKETLKANLNDQGFELLEDSNSQLINKIKTTIINTIHHSDEPLKINLSVYLSDLLHQDYGSLSRLFSSVEGITIEKYVLSQKIEKVKEFILYDELTLSEIAFHMDYSSVAYLSAQFKKETGMTPTQFKKQQKPIRNHIDSI